MIVTLKNKSELFGPLGFPVSDPGTTFTKTVSFDGIHATYLTNPIKLNLSISIDDSVKSIGSITKLSDTREFTADDFEITQNKLKFKTIYTKNDEEEYRAEVELIKTNGGIVKKQTGLITMNNPIANAYGEVDATITGFYGPIKASEIIAWNVLPKLRATGKTNEIWNSIQLTTNDYTQLVSTRNPDCWIGDLDISGIPIGNTVFTTWSQANMGCLIAPQIGIGVAHWIDNFRNGTNHNLTAGRQVCFKGNDGSLHVRTIIASMNCQRFIANSGNIAASPLDCYYDNTIQSDANAVAADIVFYLLDSPLPPSVRPLKLAGAWAYDKDNDSDSSQLETELGIVLNRQGFFGGLAFQIDQVKNIVPVSFVSAHYKAKIFDWHGITAERIGGAFECLPLSTSMFNLNGYVSNEFSTTETVNWFRNYYKENPNEQPPLLNHMRGRVLDESATPQPPSFFEDSIYRRYYTNPISGDSGTPAFFEGDNGELCVLSPSHPFLMYYANLDIFSRVIDEMKAYATYTGTVELPQIMAKPINTSKVERP